MRDDADGQVLRPAQAGARGRAAAWYGLARRGLERLSRYVADHWIEQGRRARRRRGDLRALLDLDDRMLDDIGLRRAALRAAADGVLPINQAVGRRLATQADRLDTVVPFPARVDAAPRSDLDAAA